MHNLRRDIIFFLLIVMLASLFFSRALLAISMLAFVMVSLFHQDIILQLRSFFKTPLLWGMSLLFILPLVSGLWSEDKQQWIEVIKTKAPLLFLPLAFALPFRFSTRQWSALAGFFIGVVLAASLFSLLTYAGDLYRVNEEYLRGKTLTTPLQNDHVRFSWLVFAAILLSAWLYYKERKNTYSWFLLAAALLLTICLHVLAARTGLLCFYMALGVLGAWTLFRVNWRYALLILSALIILPVASYFIFPSFKNKMVYFNYELGYFREAHYLPGANDAVRVISIKAGLALFRGHLEKGVGYGDVKKETNNWYSIHYPQMEEADKILPSSQWILFSAATGLVGAILFLVIMLIPLFTAVTYKLPWLILNISLFLSFLFDIGLEVQFGVFIYSFFVLWWWQWLKPQKV